MLTSYELDPVNQGMPAPSKYIHVNDDEDGDDNVDNDDDDDNELDPVNQDMLAPVKHIHAIGIIINNIECEALKIYSRIHYIIIWDGCAVVNVIFILTF